VASGRVVAPARIEVGVVQGGVVANVVAREGQEVKAGDLLLRLDDRIEAAGVAQAKAAVAQARARLLEVTEVQRGRTHAALAAAEADLHRARAQAERTRSLAASGSSTTVDVEANDTAFALAAARRDSAAVDARANDAGGAQVKLAEAQVDAARASLQLAEARLAQTRVTTLVDATVLHRGVEPGEAVLPGRTLITLGRSEGADGGGMEIIVEPDEKNLAVLRVGQSAACAADSYPESPFAATLKEISPLIDAGRGTVEVRLAVANPPAFLRTDMTVSVEITTGRKDNALVLPLLAVRDLATRAPFVLVVDSKGVARRVAIQLGARGTDVIEVVEGLDDGAVVVNDGKIKAGARVREP